MRPTLYEFAGGAAAFEPFAVALHARCLADPELNHPFSHPGQHPEHNQRLAAYLAEAFGGPARYTSGMGDQTHVMWLHAGNGDMSDLGRRFADCFMLAADDAGWPDDPEFRAVIRGYIEQSVQRVALSHPDDTDIPLGLPLPHWSWEGPVELRSGRHPGPPRERASRLRRMTGPWQGIGHPRRALALFREVTRPVRPLD